MPSIMEIKTFHKKFIGNCICGICEKICMNNGWKTSVCLFLKKKKTKQNNREII